MSVNLESDPVLKAYLKKAAYMSEHMKPIEIDSENRYYRFEDPKKRIQGICDSVEIFLDGDSELIVAREIERQRCESKARITTYKGTSQIDTRANFWSNGGTTVYQLEHGNGNRELGIWFYFTYRDQLEGNNIISANRVLECSKGEYSGFSTWFTRDKLMQRDRSASESTKVELDKPFRPNFEFDCMMSRKGVNLSLRVEDLIAGRTHALVFPQDVNYNDILVQTMREGRDWKDIHTKLPFRFE